jgi:hypothetical protein
MKLFALVALAGIAAVAHADVITQWDFNGTTGTTTPNVGSGTASLVGTTGAFGSGNANGGSSDPNTSATNFGWQITGFAAQGADSGNRGVQFLASTAGYTSIIVTFDQRHSNTSSRFYAGQYTVDGGTNWVTATTFEGNAGDTWFNNRTIDLSAVSAADNNANFGVRVVAVFAAGTNAYAASNAGSSYAATGTARFDMVTVNGTLIPTPGAIALAGCGGLLAARRRR